ncbi:hypothetical protein C7999DRAFT_30056 [Corynascus novoguineensis]|uniref:Uncharacterized protein n=1 Tax=Corynascus novoguineensis TaxID=1126955 RepID=A0AAN7HSH4_9PEZI|nr:hypothetical protein C7999DRAFT_30056 [Corynascus novoguineensis]
MAPARDFNIQHPQLGVPSAAFAQSPGEMTIDNQEYTVPRRRSNHRALRGVDYPDKTEPSRWVDDTVAPHGSDSYQRLHGSPELVLVNARSSRNSSRARKIASDGGPLPRHTTSQSEIPFARCRHKFIPPRFSNAPTMGSTRSGGKEEKRGSTGADGSGSGSKAGSNSAGSSSERGLSSGGLSLTESHLRQTSDYYEYLRGEMDMAEGMAELAGRRASLLITLAEVCSKFSSERK